MPRVIANDQRAAPKEVNPYLVLIGEVEDYYLVLAGAAGRPVNIGGRVHAVSKADFHIEVEGAELL